MKPSHHTTFTEPHTTIFDVARWGQALTQLHARIAPRFARPETRHRALTYLQGLLSAIERKNGWQLAEYAREARPDGMQRLLASSVWDEDLVRDDLRAYILETLGALDAILVIDETSMQKQGKKSAGVQIQHCGTTGERENCQVGVFLSYVTARGHTLLDRELYVPNRWFDDPERCREAGIPETTRFQTKCELASLMVERIVQAQIPIRWVVADCVYGSNATLRDKLHAHRYHYVLAVRCNEPIVFQTPTGRVRMTVAEAEARFIQAADWRRLSMGEGTKGPRWFDWVCLPMLHGCEDDGQHWMLIRRLPTDPTKKVYYVVFGPVGTTLTEMVEAISARWHIEEDFETAKDSGMDQYEVRTWTAWYRAITLAMLAQAFLARICAQEQVSEALMENNAVQEKRLLPLTRPEIRHLLGHLLWPHPQNAPLLLAWSWWRRCHRSLASFYHSKRRREKGEPVVVLAPQEKSLG
jgi:SRSO17 transposase